MDVSIPARAGDGNGDAAPELGQGALDAALKEGAARAALLVVDGVPAAAAAAACGDALRRVDASSTLALDRFAVLAPHLRETGGAADLAARMLAALPERFEESAAIGIAVAPEDGDAWGALLETAEGAAARAAGYARGRFAFADAERDAKWRIGPLLAEAIAEALAEQQFELAYQPIARLHDGVQVGAEALLRWPRPGGEIWPPSIFIPEAERRGLMEPITAWTVKAACDALVDAPPDQSIGVNLSATMLGAGAAEMVARLLDQSGAAPGRLTVEITETAAFLHDPEALADVEALAALGCPIAIDDFGAGNASLAYVVRLPASRIKLDASLTHSFERNERARAAIAATARLAADVGADVVAEGVRTEAQAQALADLGVGLGQGAFFGRPAVA